MANITEKTHNPHRMQLKMKISKSLLTEPKEIELRWRNHFENLFNPAGQDVEEFEVNYQVNSNDEPDIMEDELNNALNKMKKDKTPGDDGIPDELLKNLGDAGTFQFLELYTGFWNGVDNPVDWVLDIICPKCPIYKKKGTTGISLLPHPLKVYEIMLESRVRECVEQTLSE
ncbi:uncharacterized protein [Palaemon carinicauda]|uniref:uncharacterized protein n=1 Tax=Palaemon carinicauda TaxID=392227 RepID=UPI0035B654C9